MSLQKACGSLPLPALVSTNSLQTRKKA